MCTHPSDPIVDTLRTFGTRTHVIHARGNANEKSVLPTPKSRSLLVARHDLPTPTRMAEPSERVSARVNYRDQDDIARREWDALRENRQKIEDELVDNKIKSARQYAKIREIKSHRDLDAYFNGFLNPYTAFLSRRSRHRAPHSLSYPSSAILKLVTSSCPHCINSRSSFVNASDMVDFPALMQIVDVEQGDAALRDMLRTELLDTRLWNGSVPAYFQVSYDPFGQRLWSPFEIPRSIASEQMAVSKFLQDKLLTTQMQRMQNLVESVDHGVRETALAKESDGLEERIKEIQTLSSSRIARLPSRLQTMARTINGIRVDPSILNGEDVSVDDVLRKMERMDVLDTYLPGFANLFRQDGATQYASRLVVAGG